MPYPFDPLLQKYPSRRTPLYARGGMVNRSSPQASAAGLKVLRRGGNAIDAAVAAAAALTVTEPTSNGLGSDAFAIVWSAREKKLFGLNASGPAPMLASAETVLAEGKDNNGKMPTHGWTPVTVPGAPAAWAALSGRFGALPLSAALAPAVSYARDGYPCPPHLAQGWQQAYESYRERLTEPCFKAWFRTFAPNGRAPEAGELVSLPDHADSLEALFHALPDLLRRYAYVLRTESHVFLDDLRNDLVVGVLEHHSCHSADLPERLLVPGVHAVDPDCPLCREQQSVQVFREGRFARAVVSQDSDELAGLYLQVHTIDRPHRTGGVAFIVSLYIIVYQLLYFDHGRRTVSCKKRKASENLSRRLLDVTFRQILCIRILIRQTQARLPSRRRRVSDRS